jgi:hypothetical protein
MRLANLSSTFSDILASIVELLYDHNIEQPTANEDDLILRRMELQLRLEAWKDSIPSPWRTILLAEIEDQSSTDHEMHWVSILLSIHYRRAQLLINRPLLTHGLRTWVLDATPLSRVFTDELLSIARADFEAAKELSGIVQTLILTDSGIVQRHAIWFLANYSGIFKLHSGNNLSDIAYHVLVFAACVHLFGILLGCTTQPDIFVAATINRTDVRSSLQHSLEVLQNIGRKSLMSVKGAACLLRFLEVMDAFREWSQLIPG